MSGLTQASIIIPTFNGSRRIGSCLDALLPQIRDRDIEIIVVDDGSTDDTSEVVLRRPEVQLLTQQNSGPASARNHGASAARGELVLFTDDDCVPAENWVDTMVQPFSDPELIGAKGVYRTQQRELVARFVQAEYEDKYRFMKTEANIDFIDTYSAIFRRSRFLAIGGYDTSFPVACAEDVELSYRMSARGWRMEFNPNAAVYHTHPTTLSSYLKKKFKFAYWRVYALHKNPEKAVKDSHTPQLMKLQLLFLPVLSLALALDVVKRPHLSYSLCVLAAFLVSTLPFSLRVARKDLVLAFLSPLFLAARSVAQVLGVLGGTIYSYRQKKTLAASTAS